MRPYFAPEDDTAFLLQRAHRRVRAALGDVLAPFGLNLGHFAVLGLLLSREGLTQRQLIEILEIDKSAMVGLIDELERRGLAQRHAVPSDRRAHAIHLTEDGRTAARDLGHLIGEAERAFFGPLSEAEQVQLRAFLVKVAP